MASRAETEAKSISESSDSRDEFWDEMALQAALLPVVGGPAQNAHTTTAVVDDTEDDIRERDRDSLVDYIQNLARQVPMWVLQRLCQEAWSRTNGVRNLVFAVGDENDRGASNAPRAQPRKKSMIYKQNFQDMAGGADDDGDNCSVISDMSMEDNETSTTSLEFCNGFIQPTKRRSMNIEPANLQPNLAAEFASIDLGETLDDLSVTITAVGETPHEYHDTTINLDFLKQGDDALPNSQHQNTWHRECRAPSLQHHNDLPKLPYVSRHDCAMLFVDISGFTKLSTMLDAESLSKTINSYFQIIVNEINGHGGDILKFAGDAVFAEWRVSEAKLVEKKRLTIEGCVAVAATCGATIVAKCSDYPVYANVRKGTPSLGAQVTSLNVHCGIGVGNLVALHVGNQVRRENLVLGDPIDQVAAAEHLAECGQVVASPESLIVLSRSSDLSESLGQSIAQGKPGVIATRETVMFTPTEPYRFQYANRMGEDIVATGVKRQIEGMDMMTLTCYRQLISLYVHPVSVANGGANDVLRTTSTQRLLEEAELRNVCVLFIKPMIPTKVSGNDEDDLPLFSLLNAALNVTTRELGRFHGHLRQYIVDDKGVVLICTFGLRGSTFPNMVSEHALPVATIIQNALVNELGIDNRIGITSGLVYCGLVGGEMRHEYAVLGRSVNLSARLMASESNRSILVDDKIRSMAGKAYTFSALPPVKAKGYQDPVPIFEPLDPTHRGFGRKLTSNFVGRETELNILDDLAQELIAATNSPAKFVWMSGPTGIGKTTLSVHAIDNFRKTALQSRKGLFVTKHVSKGGDSLVPFSVLQSILVDTLNYFDRQHDTGDSDSLLFGNSFSGIRGLRARDDYSAASSAKGSISNRIADHLAGICLELNTPPEFLELVHHVLRVDIHLSSKGDEKPAPKTDESKLQGLVNAIALVFQTCIESVDVTIIALDDAHLLDKMSWKVLIRLFETAPNIFILCTSRPLPNYKLAIDDETWNVLHSTYSEDGRFIPLRIGLLSLEEVKTLTADTLSINANDLSDRLHRAVFTQSGGMPHYANEILQSMKTTYSCRRRRSIGLVGETTAYASLEELLLSRVDGFETPVRDALSLGAVMGESFTLLDVVDVMNLVLSGNDDSCGVSLAKNIETALGKAVEEGVLYVEYGGGDMDDAPVETNDEFDGNTASIKQEVPFVPRVEDISFTFCHDIWRSSILNIMLDSRKRDTHRLIALTLESRRETDFVSNTILFNHLRSSGDFVKAASVALSVARDFVSLGLYDECIQILQECLGMWTLNESFAEKCDDYPKTLLDVLRVEDIEGLIKLHIALGKCLATTYDVAGSVASYQAALKVLKEAGASIELKDRSIGFPIFSGLYMAIRFGHVTQDEECMYEQNLVAKFVEETEVNGDLIHFTRALAMQGEMYSRLGHFEKALSAHRRLAEVYVAEDHHILMSEAYGSDRAAQSFSASAVWLVIMGRTDEALQTCRFVIDELMPKMDIRNVHNATVMLYPVIFIMKDNGLDLAIEARSLFQQYFGTPFQAYFGDGGRTFFLPVFKPIMMCFDLFIKRDEDVPEFEDYLVWALQEENLRLGRVINNVCAGYGRMADAICAEICFLLAKRLGKDRFDVKEKLIRCALTLLKETRALVTTESARSSLWQIARMENDLRVLSNVMKIKRKDSEIGAADKDMTMDIMLDCDVEGVGTEVGNGEEIGVGISFAATSVGGSAA